jgi:phosphoglycerate kinase
MLITKIKTLDDIDITGKRILLRIDINSAVVNGKVLDSPRFAGTIGTIKELIKEESKIVLLAHQGRKGGSDYLPSLEQHSKILSMHVGRRITYIDDVFGKKARKAIQDLQIGGIILLKNIRAYKDEFEIKKKDNKYRELCNLFDVYVNDAFSVSHRKHGSVVLPPKYLPSCIGRSFENELKALEHFHIYKSGKRAFIIGGAKIEDYFPLFLVLKEKNTKLLISGILANLFLIAQGRNFGYENKWLEKHGYFNFLPRLRVLLKKYKRQIILPVDFAFKDINGKRKEILLQEFPIEEKILDAGIHTIKFFKEQMQDARVIFMKGPLGFSELPQFSFGTVEILKNISKLTREKKIISVIGGGHLTTTVEKYKIPILFSHISTSGGALISYLSGNVLPGIAALEIKRK